MAEEEKEQVVQEEDDFSFDDDRSDLEESNEDKDPNEGENGDKEKNTQSTPKQSSKQNHEQKLKRLEKEAYTKGQIDAIKINPYTKKEIKTEEDLELYKLMKEASDQGQDAVIEGYSAYFAKQAKEKEEALLKQSNDEKIKAQQVKQLEQFKKAVPDVKERERLLSDPNFKDLYEELIEKGGDLGKAAKAFLKMEESLGKKASIREEAKNSQPPSPNDGSDGRVKTIDSMSDEEVHKEFEKRFKRSF